MSLEGQRETLTSISEYSDAKTLSEKLCREFCSDIVVREKRGSLLVSMPLSGRDGDRFTVYVTKIPGGWRLSDKASTMMRLSYENDVNKMLQGARGKLFKTILCESGISDDDGELFLDVPANALTRGLFTLSQGMSRIEDLALWTKNRTESTFYDDLRAELMAQIGGDRVKPDFLIPGLPNAENYAVDYFIEGQDRPIYLFGVGNNEKAQLTTIILQYIAHHGMRFHSMVVCSDMDTLSRPIRFRLMDAANDVLPSLEGHSDALRRKIADRIAL